MPSEWKLDQVYKRPDLHKRDPRARVRKMSDQEVTDRYTQETLKLKILNRFGRQSEQFQPHQAVEIAGNLDAGAVCGRRLDQVKRYVLANLHDADMTIESIATAHNVAPRTLHRLFSVEECTWVPAMATYIL